MTDSIVAPAAGLPPRGEDVRDENGNLHPELIEAVREALAAGDSVRLVALAGDLHEADLGDLIEALDPDERPRLVALMGEDFDFAALTEIEDTVREDLLEEMPNAQIAEGVRELDSDDAVYILEDLAEEDQEEVLAALPTPDRATLERSLDYPEESAGRRMQSDVIALPPFWTVGQAIDFLRESEELPEEFYELYVVDAALRVLGRVPLNRMLRAKRPVKIEKIMLEAEHRVAATDDQHEVAELFKRYNLVAIPVEDAEGKLVGVLTFDDIVDVIDQEADAEIRALGGVQADEELGDSTLETARRRFSWLFVNLITAILASAVIGFFEGALQKMVALAVLMPIVASQGGNAGTQTMTVAVRALATRALGGSGARRFVAREIRVGLLNGVAFALVMGAVAALWFRSVDLGLVMGIAIIVNLIAAALAGVLVPLALDRIGVDPAVASGPFVTTVTDMVGFFAFLGVATLWFGLS
ncbi:MAG: magnesium transporter [Methylobacterium sp.]|nr:magnesium transporter [Methylobacterium sp.]MCA3606616.1 magnesium transporter [Methylobacterium sp.]MCA3608911.1 magnesium transporter [Methylobacterium sp.]MCA3618570.1 magnesium transporter [Methylobacterium sp.]MCA3621904.1 magnesium transporter [Methylobacterium sp.]